MRVLHPRVPPGVVLADTAYGASEDFRDGIRDLGLHYAVGIDPRTKVMVYDKRGRRRSERVSVKELALDRALTSAYQDVLGRALSAAEAATWLAVLAAGD